MKVRYAGDTTGNGLSGFWADCPMWEVRDDPSVGYGFFDDFVCYGLRAETLTTVVDITQGYIAFASSGGTIAADDAVGGGIVLAETTADEGVVFTTNQHPFNITSLGGDLWFEARVKPSHTATTEQGMFVGLMDTTAVTAIVPLTATTAIADINCVGFHKQDANTTAFDAAYKADGVTAVVVNEDVGTLAAATYIKLGMKYTQANATLAFYIDGAKQTTTKTIPNATGTDFPADVTLGPVVAMQVGAGASDNTLTMDWWGCYQLRV
jgi:hypothetical protein